MRINKYIASTGYCSRREADKLIKEGFVFINGNKADIGSSINENDEVKVKDKIISEKEDLVYYLLNKPIKVLCSNKDDRNRKLAIDLIDTNKRIYTFGRLDYMSEGLIILSNDGDFYNEIMHPSKKLYKTYEVTLNKKIKKEQIEQIENGIMIDGVKTLASKVKQLKDDLIQISIIEGKNRQIRKMIEKLDLKVKKLKRISIGNLQLDGLKEGKYRKLTKKEIKDLII